jgi:predicted Holliday junction resolvase-like endonuclease
LLLLLLLLYKVLIQKIKASVIMKNENNDVFLKFKNSFKFQINKHNWANEDELKINKKREREREREKHSITKAAKIDI